MGLYDISKLPEILQNNDIDGIADVIHEMAKSVKQKISLLCSLYCEFYVDKNYWFLHKVHSLLQKAENETILKKQREYLRQLYSLFKYKTPRCISIDLTYDIRDIHTLLQNQTHMILPEMFKTNCTEHAISILNILYQSVIYGDIQNAVLIMKYIMDKDTTKQWKEFFQKEKNDIVSVFFDVLLSLKELPQECRDYIGIAKDMFFYKLTTKSHNEQRIQRLSLLFYSIYIAVSMSISYKKIKVPISMSAMDERMSYLFVYTEKDEECSDMILENKTKRKKDIQHTRCRSMTVSNKDYEKLEKMRQQLNIIRIR